MAVSVARKIAHDVLCRVAGEGAYASDLLNIRLSTRLTPGIARNDAALATELTLGVLRWQRLLDFLLQRHLDRPLRKLDIEVLIALRLGLYQLRYLERIPAHAAVSESAEMAKSARKRSAVALINAVLRRAAAEARASVEDLERWIPAGDPAERAGILFSHPTWMVERWLSRYGEQRTRALLEANNRAPRLSCAVLAEDPAAITASLQAAGLSVTSGRWLGAALAVSGGNATVSDAFRQGQISLQDEASQMIGHLLEVQPGDRVLDLCAAPGGKAALLAHAAGPGGLVIAGDLHQHRLRSMETQHARTRTANVQPIALDATQPLPFSGQFARILVDAPCSGTGTLSRNPEIRWRLGCDALADAQRAQAAMLSNALQCLAPGGRLVYSTCSLEVEENEEIVRGAPQAHADIRVVSGQRALAPHLLRPDSVGELFDAQGFFRTFPPETQTDGFFAAVLERSA
jgi:16S rRNA (cytosine967-C5)-methyltransferase